MWIFFYANIRKIIWLSANITVQSKYRARANIKNVLYTISKTIKYYYNKMLK